MIKLDSVSLEDIAPDSITRDKNIRATIAALDPELKIVSRETKNALILPRLDELPEGIVDLLAWQYHVDFYDTALTIEQKRNLVRDSILWHRHKGTSWAVKRVLENLGLKCNVKEWFDTGAPPYTFSVEIVYPEAPSKTFTFMGENTEELLRAAINDAKPARADLTNLVATTIDQIEHDGYIPEVHVCVWDADCLWDHSYIETIGKPEILKADLAAKKAVFALDYSRSTAAITQSYLIWNVSNWDDCPYTAQPKPGLTFIATSVAKPENQYVKYTELTDFAETESVWDCGEWDGNTVNEPYYRVRESVGTWDGSAVWNALATVPDDGSQYHTLDSWHDRENWATGTWASLEALDKETDKNKPNLYEPRWLRVEHFGMDGNAVIDISDFALSQAECKQQFFSYFSLRTKILNDAGSVKSTWHERSGYTWRTAPDWGGMTWKDEAYFILAAVFDAAAILDDCHAQTAVDFSIRDFARYLVGPVWDFVKWDNSSYMKANVFELEEHVSQTDRLNTFGIRATEGVFEIFTASEAVWNATEADGLTVLEPRYRVMASVGEWDNGASFDAELNPPEPVLVKVENFSTDFNCVIDVSDIANSARAGTFVYNQAT